MPRKGGAYSGSGLLQMHRGAEEIKLLVVDDDLRMCQLIEELIDRRGLSVSAFTESTRALEAIKQTPPDILITDLKMPEVGGMELLKAARSLNSSMTVIVITGYGTVNSAVEAMKLGAYDYIEKPFEPEEFMLVLDRAVEHVRLLKENRRLKDWLNECRTEEIMGQSRAITEIKELVSRVAPLDTTVLIQGETGTGKELVARAIHRLSARRDALFLPVNCGSLPESLLESELFGYEKGAFTGAERQKKGLFEAASGGTIFLDEINATTQNFQVKLLRVLQEGEILRVGGTRPQSVDVRIIASTNVALEKEIEHGRFRRDLYYRLNVVSIKIPPLRKRRDDIPLLAHFFLNKYSEKYNKAIHEIHPDLIRRMMKYHWPGNVRELENAVERAVIMETSDTLNNIEIPDDKISPETDLSDTIMSIEEMERILITRALQKADGKREIASRMLGISPVTLWRKMKRYKLN